jgi:hypothetical protein
MSGAALPRERIQALLERGGWPVVDIAPGVWRTALRGETVTFQVWVSDEGDFVRFAIAPMLRCPRSEARVPLLHDKLLRLTPAVRMARFALSPEGDVELIADYPTAHLDAPAFRDCLDTLLYYADRHYPALAAICRG